MISANGMVKLLVLPAVLSLGALALQGIDAYYDQRAQEDRARVAREIETANMGTQVRVLVDRAQGRTK